MSSLNCSVEIPTYYLQRQDTRMTMLRDSRKLVNGIKRLINNFSPKMKPSKFLIGKRQGMVMNLNNTNTSEVKISQQTMKAMKSRQRQRVKSTSFLYLYLPTKNIRFLISRLYMYASKTAFISDAKAIKTVFASFKLKN